MKTVRTFSSANNFLAESENGTAKKVIARIAVPATKLDELVI